MGEMKNPDEEKEKLLASVCSMEPLKKRPHGPGESVRDSPFLRNKDTTSSWKLQRITERFVGWAPAETRRFAQADLRRAPAGEIRGMQSKAGQGMKGSTSLPDLHADS